MDVTIHGDDWSKTFYWPDALPAAKPPMEMEVCIIYTLMNAFSFVARTKLH